MYVSSELTGVPMHLQAVKFDVLSYIFQLESTNNNNTTSPLELDENQKGSLSANEGQARQISGKPVGKES